MATSGEAPAYPVCRAAGWQRNVAGYSSFVPVLLPVDDFLQASAIPLTNPPDRLPVTRSPAHLLPDRGNACRLKARVLRKPSCIGALSHESYLSSVLELRQPSMDSWA